MTTNPIPKPPPPQTGKRPRWILWAIIAPLGAVAFGLAGYWLWQLPKPNNNQLAIGDLASIETLDIPLQAPIELDFKTRTEILQLRAQAVQQHRELLRGAYRPADAVFAQIEDRLPWWGLTGFFYYGSGNQSIEGVSEEARFLLNPYLLIGIDLYHNWKYLPEAGVLSSSFVVDCAPTQLRWQPRERRGEATYSAACIGGTNARLFDLIAYNARDMNLNYIYVSYIDSQNVTKLYPGTAPYAIPHYLHRGGSCGYPGGCNNMSPPSPDIDGLEIVGFPAHVTVWLWQDNPNSLTQTPDMIFRVKFQ